MNILRNSTKTLLIKCFSRFLLSCNCNVSQFLEAIKSMTINLKNHFYFDTFSYKMYKPSLALLSILILGEKYSLNKVSLQLYRLIRQML